MANKGLNTEKLLEEYSDPIEEIDGILQYAVYDQEEHSIIIKFDQIFNMEKIKQHNVLRIQHKRYYSPGTPNSSSKPMLPVICRDINYIMNQDSDVIRKYANIIMHTALKEKKSYDLNKFEKDIYELIFHIKDLIINNIDFNCITDIPVPSEKINVDLQVTKEMNNRFIQSANAIRIVIPLICNYTLSEKSKNNSIFYKIFRKILLIFSDNNIKSVNDLLNRKENTEISLEDKSEEEKNNNALNKLWAITRSRVEQTKYANKKIWKILNIHTKDVLLINMEFYQYLIENIIPKLDNSRAAIKFIDVVLRKKLEYAFTYNFPDEYKPLRNVENDDDTDERDRLNETIYTRSKNEASLALNKCTILQTINSFINDLEISEEEIETFKKKNLKNKNINNVQLEFIILRYNKKFEVHVTTEKNRVYLLFKLIKDLEELGYTEIPKMLRSTAINEVDTRNKVAGKKIMNQKLYKEILETYKNTKDIIAQNNFVSKLVSFKNYTFLDENNEPITINSNEFESEIMKFILLVSGK